MGIKSWIIYFSEMIFVIHDLTDVLCAPMEMEVNSCKAVDDYLEINVWKQIIS